jgi:hypothetical protein
MHYALPMGYFSAQLHPRPLEAPHPVVLWPDPAGWRVTWGQPPLGVLHVQITRGDGVPYSQVATAPAHQRWWLLPEVGGTTIGVAWRRGTEIGAVTLVPLPPVMDGTTQYPCPLCHQALEWKERQWQCLTACGARWVSQFGQLVDVANLPFGLCTCCAQAQPLLQNGEGLLCPVSQKPYAPALSNGDILTAIDKALQENQAKVGVFGLFDV